MASAAAPGNREAAVRLADRRGEQASRLRQFILNPGDRGARERPRGNRPRFRQHRGGVQVLTSPTDARAWADVAGTELSVS